jgi:hypothetical protein
MDLKKYAYDMRVLSVEDQKRGNPSGIEMGWELFRQGCLTGAEPLEGFDSGVDWVAAQNEWNATMDTQTKREAAIAELQAQRAAYEDELAEAFRAGDRAKFDSIMYWPRHSEEEDSPESAE